MGNRSAKTDTASSNVTTYAYDYRQRLTGVTIKTSGGTVNYQATYTYDTLNRRIGTNVDADGAGANAPVQSWTVYDGQDTYADFNGAGTLQARYLNGPAVDELFARTDSAGTTSWYLTDRQNSVRNLVNSSGTITGTISYDSFGKPTTSGTTDRFGYTGREFDTATGLQYNRARYYDAAIGRWTQDDPIGFGGRDANLYRYVGNSPTNASDPSGLADEPAWYSSDDEWWPGGYLNPGNWPVVWHITTGIPLAVHHDFNMAMNAGTTINQQLTTSQIQQNGLRIVAEGTAKQNGQGALVDGVNRPTLNMDTVAGMQRAAQLPLDVAGGAPGGLPKPAPLGAQIVAESGVAGKIVRNEAKAVPGKNCPAPNNQFKLGKHGDMPTPRPGQESHHGAMSAWMKKNFCKYDPDQAPAILMPEANHHATFGVYNKWRAAMKQKMGSTFDWGKVSEQEMRALSEQMFDAAQVPQNLRQDYWAWFERMKGALTP